MSSIFTKIVNGEIPSFKVAENDDFLAFLDVFPLTKGHVLVIPKKEVNKIFELDKETYSGLMDFAYDVAQALEKTIPCLRVGMSVIGLEVPHVHVHLLPLNSMDDINFSNPKMKFPDEEMAKIAAEISKNFKS